MSLYQIQLCRGGTTIFQQWLLHIGFKLMRRLSNGLSLGLQYAGAEAEVEDDGVFAFGVKRWDMEEVIWVSGLWGA